MMNIHQMHWKKKILLCNRLPHTQKEEKWEGLNSQNHPFLVLRCREISSIVYPILSVGGDKH